MSLEYKIDFNGLFKSRGAIEQFEHCCSVGNFETYEKSIKAIEANNYVLRVIKVILKGNYKLISEIIGRETEDFTTFSKEELKLIRLNYGN